MGDKLTKTRLMAGAALLSTGALMFDAGLRRGGRKA